MDQCCNSASAMTGSRRWSVRDRYGHDIYLRDERWRHIIDPSNHPEMSPCEDRLKETIRTGTRKQDPLNPLKYRYMKEFENLAADNTHVWVLCCSGSMRTMLGNRSQTITS